MKAKDIKRQLKPPRVFTLPVTAFADNHQKPTAPVQVGLRLVSGDERLLADTEATKKASELLPGFSPTSEQWQRAYDVLLFHAMLGFAVCDPENALKPRWAGQESFHIKIVDGQPVSARFTESGLGRLYDELEILSIDHSATRRAVSDEELAAVGIEVSPTFWATLSTGDGPDEEAEQRRRNLEEQVRRLLDYVIEIHDAGIGPLYRG